jgi:hypothetical protein
MTGKWQIGKDVEGSDCGLLLKALSRYSIEGLRKTTKNFGHGSRTPGRDLNTRRPEYEAKYKKKLKFYKNIQELGPIKHEIWH